MSRTACVNPVADGSTLSCANPPISFLNSRARRDKARQRLATAFGPGLPADRSVPTEFKICFPNGAFANLNNMHVSGVRPAFLRGERIRAPAWWQHAEVMAPFDKVMLGKVGTRSMCARYDPAKGKLGEYWLIAGQEAVLPRAADQVSCRQVRGASHAGRDERQDSDEAARA